MERERNGCVLGRMERGRKWCYQIDWRERGLWVYEQIGGRRMKRMEERRNWCDEMGSILYMSSIRSLLGVWRRRVEVKCRNGFVWRSWISLLAARLFREWIVGFAWMRLFRDVITYWHGFWTIMIRIEFSLWKSMRVSRREELFGFRSCGRWRRMEMRKSSVIKIREEVVCSWFGCKERRGCLRVVGMMAEKV